MYTKEALDAVTIGNQFVAKELATGFNIVKTGDSFPIVFDGDLVLYSNYVRRVAHHGVLLAEMEQLGIISPDQVDFGSKASAVEYGGWPLDKRDEKDVTIKIINTDSTQPPVSKRFCQTTEVVLIFKPKDDIQAISIADFLLKKIFVNEPGHIPESWEVPDIRATQTLKFLADSPLLRKKDGGNRFQTAIINFKHDADTALYIMLQDEKLDQNWQNREIPINAELREYLIVKPELT